MAVRLRVESIWRRLEEFHSYCEKRFCF